jgi:hypothetical protein
LPTGRHLLGREIALEPAAEAAAIVTATAAAATTATTTTATASSARTVASWTPATGSAAFAPGHEVDQVIEIALLFGVGGRIVAAENADQADVVGAIPDHVERLDQAREAIALDLQRLFERRQRRVRSQGHGLDGLGGLGAFGGRGRELLGRGVLGLVRLAAVRAGGILVRGR